MSITSQRYKSRIGERLARILSERGYASNKKPGGIQFDRVAEILNRQHVGRQITTNMIRKYIYNGATISLEVAALFASTFKFRLDELAYEDSPPPVPKYNRVRGVLDEIEPVYDEMTKRSL